jgi:hypothetical protein
MDWLDKIFGPDVDSQSQLEAARRKAKTYSAAEEAAARRAGFKSADEMVLYNRRRSGGNTVNKGRAKHAVDESIRGVRRGDAMAWHPAVILDKITEMLKGDK